ncbi:MAG: MerR family transcriptional regulator [Acidobacteriota bacterium]|jgi:DNA-binding transcriptional MerR regulator|nr:MerR family transcriptional regulator [Acidobacteriota bacterium]
MAFVPTKLYYKIREVCDIADVEAHVLRFWETEFPALAPPKSRTGQRTYRPKDIELVLTIRKLLYDDGFTIVGARRQMGMRDPAKPRRARRRRAGRRDAAARSIPPTGAWDGAAAPGGAPVADAGPLGEDAVPEAGAAPEGGDRSAWEIAKIAEIAKVALAGEPLMQASGAPAAKRPDAPDPPDAAGLRYDPAEAAHEMDALDTVDTSGVVIARPVGAEDAATPLALAAPPPRQVAKRKPEGKPKYAPLPLFPELEPESPGAGASEAQTAPQAPAGAPTGTPAPAAAKRPTSDQLKRVQSELENILTLLDRE